MGFLTGIFLVILAGILSDTVIKIVKSRSLARQTDPALLADVAELQRQLHEQSAVLADTQAQLVAQDQQLQELHERVDFAERLLAQERDRPGLRPGNRPAPPEQLPLLPEQ